MSNAAKGSGHVLHVFTDGTDTYVASDLQDLQVLYKEETGSTMEEMQGPDELDAWSQIDDNEDITVMLESGEKIPPVSKVSEIDPCDRVNPEWSKRVVAKASAWASTSGRGLLCSTEW